MGAVALGRLLPGQVLALRGGRLVEGANRRVEILHVPTAGGDGEVELLVGVDLVDACGGRWPVRVLPCT